MDLGSIILMAYDEQSSKSEGEDNMYDSLLFRMAQESLEDAVRLLLPCVNSWQASVNFVMCGWQTWKSSQSNGICGQVALVHVAHS